MRLPVTILIMLSLIASAAIFGFFYAWVCSTMWGLDATDPRVAIQAMQAMNASVRNPVFAPAFFGTPVLLFLSAVVLWHHNRRASATLFGLSSVIYLCLGMILTMAVNVPMNEALAQTPVPDDIDAARQIWLNYSPDWQFWNQFRTIASGLSFAIAVAGVMTLSRGGSNTA